MMRFLLHTRLLPLMAFLLVASPAPSDETNLVAYHGRVVDEDDKPIAGAELWYALPTARTSPLGDIIGSGSIRKVAATDSDGNFSFSVPPPKWTGHKYYVESMRLTAKATGYGCDRLPLTAFETNPVPSEWRDNLQSQTDKEGGVGRFASRTLKLPTETGPIKGRLVDLEGRPLAGVEICVESVAGSHRESASSGWLSSTDWQVLFPPPKTNENGEFAMLGLGHNQIATVTLRHERVEAERLFIVGSKKEEQQSVKPSRREADHREFYLGAMLTHAIGPAIPLSGVVTELQSGKSVANARVHVARLFRERGRMSRSQVGISRHIKTVTDGQGRYNLVGIPPGKGHLLQVTPETDEPLFPLTQEFSLDSAQTSATVDVQIVRGMWIEGKVTDAESGEPLPGIVDYFPFRKNPEISKFGGRFGTIDKGRFHIDESGHYRVAGLTGPGVVMVATSRVKAYPKAAGTDKIEGYDAKKGDLPSVMVGSPLSNWNQISFVEPPAGADSYRLDITLTAGLTLRGHVVAPDGSPAADVEVLGQIPRDEFFQKLKDETFSVTDYSSEHPRDLFFTAMKGSLVAHLHLEGTPPEELKVELQPAVTVRGRLVETETNEPASGYHLYCRSSKLGEFRIDRDATDDEGRFEVKGLLAGNVYKMDAANRRRFISRKNGFTIDLTNAKPGDVIELGDVTGKNARKEK